MAWWWDRKLTDGFLPFQVGSDWLKTPIKVPTQALREDFVKEVGEIPLDWESNLATYFGKSFSRVAFPNSKLLRDKILGHYVPGSEHFPRMSTGALPLYIIPPHHICDYLFVEVTRIRYPDFKAFQEDNGDTPPTTIWKLV